MIKYLILITLVFYSTSNAIILKVPQDYSTIQDGIDAALDSDTVLVSDGVYWLTGNTNIKLNGKAIMVKSENGPQNTILNIYDIADTAFIFNNGEDSLTQVDGFQILNLSIAFYCDSSSPKISNCIVNEINKFAHLDNYSSPVFENCQSIKNSSGIISFDSAPKINNCIFNYGGGLQLIRSNAMIYNSMFNNYSRGVYSNESDFYMENCSISRNTISDFGGGIYAINSDFTMESCYIYNNIASFGAGMRLDGSNPIINNCTFAYNAVTTFGSAVNLWFSSPEFNNCLFASNRYDKAIHCSDLNSTPTLNCCNIYGNDNGAGDWVDCIAGQYGVNGNISVDPMICNVETGNLQLSHFSPCLPENNSCNTQIGAFGIGGDLNLDNEVTLSDLLLLIDVYFSLDCSFWADAILDVNADGLANLADIIYLNNYISDYGPPPCDI